MGNPCLSPLLLFHIEQKQHRSHPFQCGSFNSLDALRTNRERNAVPTDRWCPREGQGGTLSPVGKPAAFTASPRGCRRGQRGRTNRKGDLLFEAGLLASPHCGLGLDRQITKYLEFHELAWPSPSALRMKELQILEIFHKPMMFSKDRFSDQIPVARHQTSHEVSWRHPCMRELHPQPAYTRAHTHSLP